MKQSPNAICVAYGQHANIAFRWAFPGTSIRDGLVSSDAAVTYSQVGRVTMDHMMIWFGEHPQKVGTTLDLLNGNAMSVNEWAQMLETIPYEICTNISERVKRVYLK
jgi:hypothetical protein